MPLRLAFTLELIALRGGPEWFTEVTSTGLRISGLEELNRLGFDECHCILQNPPDFSYIGGRPNFDAS